MLSIYSFLAQILRNRRVLVRLVKYDLLNEYSGSYFGILWAFINPLIYTVLLWFIFSIGFRSQPVKDVPFIVWLVSGLFPWQFLSQSAVSGTNSVISQTYLVKKIVFPVELLPLIKICSAFTLHLFFILLLFIITAISGISFTLHVLQLPYYIFGMLLLLLGLTWLSSSVTVFVKDISSIVSILMQLAFWATPVFWSLAILPESLQPWMRLNPFHYLVNGYRSCFVSGEWFWNDPYGAFFFWTITIGIFVIGTHIFKRLRPHFADIL